LVKGEYPVNIPQGHGEFRYPRTGTTYTEYVGGFAATGFPDGATEQQINAVGINAPYNNPWFDASSYGPAAYLSAQPKLAKVDLGVAIGELRDLPQMLKTTAKGFHDIWKAIGGSQRNPFMWPKKAAEHFLNHQFGWSPFVSDIMKTHDVYQNSATYMNTITRMNNTWIKRYRSIVNTSSNSRTARWYWPAVEPYDQMSWMLSTRTVDGQSCKGTTDTFLQEMERVWFVGSFKFYRPEFDPNVPWSNSWYGEVNRLATIYGLRINPSTIYKLTPWTWLADWFGNAGKIISYLSNVAYDGTVSRYAYVCRHKYEIYKHIYSLFYDDSIISLEYPHLVETKDRAEAPTPYGFATSWPELSPTRLAILASLGLTRS
jgi:hypothetical protein